MAEEQSKKKFKRFHTAMEDFYEEKLNGYINDIHLLDIECENYDGDKYWELKGIRKKTVEGMEQWIVDFHELLVDIAKSKSKK